MTHASIVEGSFNESSPRRAGMLVGGRGGLAELRATIAWSAIPLIVSGAFYLAALALTRGPVGHAALAASLCSAAQSMLRLGEVFFILGLWRFAVLFACNGETHALPLRQTVLVRALTAAIVVSALFALAILMLAPAVASLAQRMAATALAA
jgi:hypothetical protein